MPPSRSQRFPSLSILLPVILLLLVMLLAGALFVYQATEDIRGSTFLPSTTQAWRASQPASSGKTTPVAQPPFDFYVLALSWSPDYCATEGQNDTQQCSIGKRLGFVLHGLWPNYKKGYPQYCSTQKLPIELQARFPNLYPNSKLYDHQWNKHGTCSGLTPEAYLALSKSLRDSIHSPPAYQSPETPFRTTIKQLKSEFISVNPTLAENTLAVYCSGSGRFLSEVFVCFSPDGIPTACSNDIHTKALKSCANADFLVRNVR